MAIDIPEDWPNRTWAEDTPLAHLQTEGESGVVRWDVANWSSTREIATSSLPGQVRHKTGLSIGTAKATVRKLPDDFPWKKSLVYELTGQSAQILLAPEGLTEIPTGQFKVAEVNGDLTTLGVAVDLDERQVEGTDQVPGVLDQEWFRNITQEQINAQEKDPIWLVAELAEQMGYSSGPTPVPGQGGYTPILDVPLQGTLITDFPQSIEFNTNDTPAWGTSAGTVGLTTEKDSDINVAYEVEAALPEKVVVTMDVNDGWSYVTWEDVNSNGLFEIEMYTDAAGTEVDFVIYSYGANGVSNGITNLTGEYDITRNPDLPNRIQIEVTFTPGPTGAGYNSASIRVQREVGEWFGPLVHPMANVISRTNEYNVGFTLFHSGAGTGFLSNLSVVDATATDQQVLDDLVTTVGGSQGRIYLEPLFGTIISPWLDPELAVWPTMQAIVEAWQGALITDVYGDLHVLNRFTLVGNNNLQQERVVDVGLVFEDLPWRMNFADQADRLVLKYRPVVIQAAQPDQVGLPYIYEFQDIIIAYPGVTEVFFTLDYIYPTDLRLIPFNRKDFDNGVYHVWDAYRYNNGTGNHINPNTDLQMRIERVTSSTWKVYIRNLTGSPFHMVDNTGTPYLKIRSSYWYDQTQESVVERGLPSTDAKNPLEIDLAHYVHTEEDAKTLADFIWGRVNQRSWQADTVNIVPDYALDLGDVIEIQHRRTGVKSNALVTKVELAGEPGNLTQKVDLVLIPPTWEDFDEAWANAPGSGGLATWEEFDELWDEYTWDDFDRTPTATTVAEIEEGM